MKNSLFAFLIVSLLISAFIPLGCNDNSVEKDKILAAIDAFKKIDSNLDVGLNFTSLGDNIKEAKLALEKLDEENIKSLAKEKKEVHDCLDKALNYYRSSLTLWSIKLEDSAKYCIFRKTRYVPDGDAVWQPYKGLSRENIEVTKDLNAIIILYKLDQESELEEKSSEGYPLIRYDEAIRFLFKKAHGEIEKAKNVMKA